MDDHSRCRRSRMSAAAATRGGAAVTAASSAAASGGKSGSKPFSIINARAMAWRSGRDVIPSVVPRARRSVVRSLPVPDASRAPSRLRGWFLRDLKEGQTESHAHTAPWWQVMCLTGVDYFSSLGYQPGIAFAAAGYLSPLATIVLVGVTLFGALPIYSRIAALSPRGQGSLSMLEEVLPRWKGKAFVLCLLGFAATDFVITITLSAADATAHIIGNPFVPPRFDHPVALTLVLLGALCMIFLKGFKEAIGLAVILVAIYLVLNVIVIGQALGLVIAHPEVFPAWKAGLLQQHGSPLMMAAMAVILFPKLALGLSGFETGVAVMPLV